MNKRLVHELSIDELLESLEEGQDLIDESVSFSYENPVLSFIQAFKIQHGKEKISDKVLHRLFKIWYPGSFIEQRNFNIQLGQYIPSEMRNRRFYLVDKKVLELARKTEELIKERRNSPKSRSVKWHRHFEQFLNDNGLTEGPIFVEGDILHYVYRRWCDDTRVKSGLNHYNFIAICELNFERRRLADSNISWFGVNAKIKQLITKEEVKRWRQGRKIYGKKRNQEETTSTDHTRSRESKALYEEKKVKKKQRSLRGPKSWSKSKD